MGSGFLEWLKNPVLPIVLIVAGIFTIVSAVKGNFKHAMEALVVVLVGLIFVGLAYNPGAASSLGAKLLGWF